MSKRNLILLIIVLIAVIIGVAGFLYFRQETSVPTGEEQDTNFFSKFSPFGSGVKPTTPVVKPPVDVSGFEPSLEETAKIKLKKVSSMPIAGFAVFVKERLKNIPVEIPTEQGLPSLNSLKTKPASPPTEFMPALRYVEKATGNIYQTFADRIEERKFSETIIPKVYEAYFGNKGESVIMRYLKIDDKTIETFVGVLPREYLGGDTTPNKEIKGSFLPENVSDLNLSPDTSKAFYLFDTGDNTVGIVFNLLDNKKVQVFDSAFTEWLSFWPNDKMITLSTKPSANVPGYMYAIDLNNKSLSKIFGDINGLTTLTSPSGKLILYGDNRLSLYVYHTDIRSSDLLGVKTLPEKCIWGDKNDFIYCAAPKSIDRVNYPDAWYQGEVSFNDQFWKIDIKNGNATMLLDPALVAGGEEIDGVKLVLDKKENYLFFVNKKDSFLWKLELK